MFLKLLHAKKRKSAHTDLFFSVIIDKLVLILYTRIFYVAKGQRVKLNLVSFIKAFMTSPKIPILPVINENFIAEASTEHKISVVIQYFSLSGLL